MRKLLRAMLGVAVGTGLILVPMVSLAQIDTSGVVVVEDGAMMLGAMGPTILNRMLHAWVSLVAAIVIFVLALKFLRGGKLAQPVFLIGLGALADALLGLTASPGAHMQTMWLGSLLFSTAVVIAIVWMAKIFGVFGIRKTG